MNSVIIGYGHSQELISKNGALRPEYELIQDVCLQLSIDCTFRLSRDQEWGHILNGSLTGNNIINFYFTPQNRGF